MTFTGWRRLPFVVERALAPRPESGSFLSNLGVSHMARRDPAVAHARFDLATAPTADARDAGAVKEIGKDG